MLKHQPKSLARTLQYIGWHSPSEFGLFWDSDGTMPWKEFYWALQEDPSLRFVREAGLRELYLLGIELPFVLDGNLLRLGSGIPPPLYPVAESIPERLFYAIKPRNLASVQNTGLKATGRRFMPLCSDSALAVRIAKRRETEPILIDILARQALDGGVSLLVAGPELVPGRGDFTLFSHHTQNTSGAGGKAPCAKGFKAGAKGRGAAFSRIFYRAAATYEPFRGGRIGC